ncbi:hypothetical protein OIU80_03780 [Flavobacterium sp. LS1R47]|uniref:Uncharacterized protein n=1 Tax=Flavobacterium frigoritolerans TaxID=2987686 RepID=A0A9X3C0T5_9FLAO|nr:hypothetical protein [Flavobacterium frigoritolerans]MCV9931391.1 hypothetical protein [Flavobacterium frigoritolerans]
MKIKTLSTSFLVLSYVLFILIQILVEVIVRFGLPYLWVLIFHFTFVILLGYMATGTLVIDFQNEKDAIVIEWDKKPIYTKIENQTINLSEVKSWKVYDGRVADRLKIYFNNNKSLTIDFNNLTDFGENSKKMDELLNILKANKVER